MKAIRRAKSVTVCAPDGLGRIGMSDWMTTGLEESEYVLNVAGVHQDAVTRERATEVLSHAIQVVDGCSVRSTCCQIGGLSNPNVFRNAVQAATTADILIVSVRGANALPPNVSEWIEAWLPLRLPLAGALVALIGVPEQPDSDSSRIGHYLQDVVRRGQLEFLAPDQELPLAPPNFSVKEMAERASATPQAVSNGIEPCHWGINE